jgi:hypothetical protein
MKREFRNFGEWCAWKLSHLPNKLTGTTRARDADQSCPSYRDENVHNGTMPTQVMQPNEAPVPVLPSNRLSGPVPATPRRGG